MADTQWKPHPNQQICEWGPCPAQHGRQQHPESAPNSLHPTHRSTSGLQKPPWHQPALAALGRRCALLPALHRGQETLTGDLPLEHSCIWMDYPVSADLNGTNYSCAPSQAQANACRTRGCRICTFPCSQRPDVLFGGLCWPQFLLTKSCIQWGRCGQELWSWAASCATMAAKEMLHPQ